MTPSDPELPDAADAARAEDLVPEDPPADAPTDRKLADHKPAVDAPVPAHGEMASMEQLDEGERAVEMAGGGGVDTDGLPTGEADTGRPGQGGTGPGTDDQTIGDPEVTAKAANASRGAGSS